MKNPLLPIIAIGTLGAAGMSVSGLKETVHPPEPPAGLDAHETHGSTTILGQFRTSASSWLWLRADLYLHNGVEMRQLTEGELKSGHKGVGTSDQLMGDESTVVTTIPTKERDFRGIFGDVERAVSAFRDMKNHEHNDPEQSLPLFRLMTWVDPQFITGWQVGGAVMARGRNEVATNKALAFLGEGLEQNPESIVLRTEIARLKITRQKKLEEAIEILSGALKIAADKLDKLAENDKAALQDAFRWLALCYRNTGRYKLMRTTALMGLKVFQEDEVLGHLTTYAPSILTEEGAKSWLKGANDSIDEESLFKNEILEHEDHDHDHEHEHGDGHGHEDDHDHS